MRLLLFSDLHCDREAAQQLASRAADVDVLVGAGDFASVRRNIDIVIDVLRAVSRPAVLIPGNNESPDELRAACRDWPSAQVLHGSSTTIGGIPFFGLGGGVPVTPFGSWSFDLPEDEAARMLGDCPTAAVLVSHSPPYGCVDVSADGKHRGSTAVRETILKQAPRLVVCGHVHECAGKQAALEGTTVINAGPRGIVWMLDEQS